MNAQGEVSIWAYPWDIADIGVDTTLARVQAQGINTISLATSYHAGRFLQPGNPRRRVYYPQDGTVYYSVDPDLWTNAEIRPLQADSVATEGDMLAVLCARRAKGGPKISCWTVCLHNTRLGMAHPDHVMRTAQGDPHFYALCPSSPAARAYVTGMVAEISNRYRPDRIELESPDFLGFNHGFHHEKDGMGLLAEDSFLLGICFCDHCQMRATKEGVDAKSAQQIVSDMLDAAFARELPKAQIPEFPSLGLEAFETLPQLHDYLLWRNNPVTSLVSEIRAAAHPETSILLIDSEASWQGGVDLAQVAQHCDGIVYCVYTTPPAQIGTSLADVRQAIGTDKALVAGFQLFHPEVSNAGDLRARTTAASAEADGFNFYNLGLVPAARLGWIGAASLRMRGCD